jgi:hypothetical protein
MSFCKRLIWARITAGWEMEREKKIDTAASYT